MMQRWWRVVAVLAAGGLAGAASALDVETRVRCPAQAQANSNLVVEVAFQSCEPEQTTARLVSSIAGNEDQTLARISVFGPEVGTEVTVPAADAQPGSCQPADEGRVETSLPVPPVVPETLEGTVATFVFTTDWSVAGDDSVRTELNQCLVEVLPAAACFGDFDGDGNVTNSDVLMFRGPGCFPCASGCNAACDSNGDGRVNNIDVLALRRNFGSACP